MTTPKSPQKTLNVWFRLVILACAVFIFTIFVMLATALNGRLGALTRFFNDRGPLLLGIEVATILVLAVAAMAVDRRQTLRTIREREAALLASAESLRTQHTMSQDQKPTE
jgi:hypothetical protein